MAAQQPATGIQPVQNGAGKVFIHFTMSLDGFIADAEGLRHLARGLALKIAQQQRFAVRFLQFAQGGIELRGDLLPGSIRFGGE